MGLFVRCAVIGLLLIAVQGSSRAQEYPTGPVRIIVPFSPGGAGDILARMLGERLEEKWGNSFVVENKTGAGGVMGTAAVAKAAPDGYTLLITGSPQLAANVSLFKTLAYDPIDDYVPLALAAQTPFVLVVNPELPVHSVADLVTYAKQKRGNLTYATAGVGVPHHLFAELLKSMTGIQMSPVAYRGSMPALNDVIAGHVPLMFVDLGPGRGSIQAGTVRALGVSTRTRVAVIPDVPPLAEAGVPGFDAASWQMVVAPAKTPRPIVDKLHDELKALLDTPEIKERILQSGMVPMEYGSVEQLREFIKSEIARWGKVVRKAGLEGSQ